MLTAPRARCATAFRLTRAPALIVGIAAALLLATACSEVDRTVTDRRVEPAPVERLGTTEARPGIRVVEWESNRYPNYTLEHLACWNETVVGQPVPDVCLTTSTLTGETGPLRRSLWLTIVTVAAALYALVRVSRTRITWLPFVARTTAGDPLPHHLSSPDAVTLTHAARREQLAADARPRRSRLLLVVPLLAGLLVPAIPLPPLVLLVGFGTALGWGLIVGALLLVGVAAALIALWTPLSPGPSRAEPFFARLAFLGGAGLAFFAIAGIGLLQRTPLLELNGVALFG